MLAGRYRDVVTDRAGRSVLETSWRPNLIVDGAFTLLAALLKREAGTAGILFWAVGEGEAGWDRDPPTTVSTTSRLRAEVTRLEVRPDAIAYVDRRGAIVEGPSPDLEIRSTFEWPEERVTLREFGLFGGDAVGRSDSGVMINHVIHPRIELEPGQRLTRQLRMSFGRAWGRRWMDVGTHWLGQSSVEVIDGVGSDFATALSRAGIATVEALALSDPSSIRAAIPRVRLVEFRSKARLALRTAGEVRPPEQLFELTVAQLLTRPANDVAREAGIFEDDVTRIREQVSTLELALDHTFLRRHTIGTLARGGS